LGSNFQIFMFFCEQSWILRNKRGTHNQVRSIAKTGMLASLLILSFCLCGEGEAKDSARRSPVVVAVEKVGPSVVNVSITIQEKVGPLFPFGRDDFFKDMFPEFFGRREYSRTSLGSGVVIDGQKGYIVTNQHVVAGATEMKVIASDQKEYKARLIGSDPRSDLAVIQIEAGGQLSAARLGDSDDLMIGETVIAIGNPYGLAHTVTTGVVSAINRSVRADDTIYRHFIQTDASINPGNSGGPLLNIEGDVIGINTAIYQKAQGIGFAIPINKMKRITKELILAGEVRPLWVGAEIQELTRELKAHFDVSGSSGVLVKDVINQSPAGKAGIQRGDVVLSVQDITVTSPSEYYDALAEFTVEDTLGFKISRKGKEMAIFLRPSLFPLEMAIDLFSRRSGIRVADAMQQKGVTIKEVKSGSEASQIGLKPGDLILKINDIPVRTIDEFKKAVSRHQQSTSINLVVQRGAYAYSLTLPF
jgi:serine protease Do